MTEASPKNHVGRDALGIVLFGVAIFSAISIVMAMLRPQEVASGTTGVFMAVVTAVGAVPALVFSCGLAWLGARLWVGGVTDGTGRDLAGLVATTAGLAIFVGALSPGGGGALGEVTGGKVSAFLSPFVGALFGIACLLLPVWFLWIRPSEWISWNLGQDDEPPAALDTDSEGVSPEEAAALLPTSALRKWQERVDARMADAPEDVSSSDSSDLPELYPPDVRLQGGIPEGTHPIRQADDPRPEPSPDDVAAREAAPAEHAGAEQSPGTNLAPEDPSPAVVVFQRSAPEQPDGHDVPGESASTVAEAPATRPAQPARTPAPTEARAAEAAAPEAPVPPRAPATPGAPPLASTGVPEGATPIGGDARPLAPEAGSEGGGAVPPSPSWEQSGLFDEEPVDAYGTPLSLVETLRSGEEHAATEGDSDEPSVEEPTLAERAEMEARAEAAAAEEEAADDSEHEEAAEYDDEEEEGEDSEAAEYEEEDSDAEEEDEDEEEDDEAAEYEEEEDEEEYEDDEAAEYDEEDEEEDDDDLDEEAAELEDEEDEEAAELEDDEEDEEAAEAAELEDEEDEEDEEAAELEDEEDEEAAELEDEEDEEAAELEDEEAAELEDEEDEEAAELEEQAEDDEEEAAELEEDESAEVASEPLAEDEVPPEASEEPEPAAGAEREVVLTPVARGDIDPLALKAGALILERNRVAVSMLQREFGLDFKQSTAVLDQLQEVGLIGPYLGGQRRDILLSADEWRERVGSA